MQTNLLIRSKTELKAARSRLKLLQGRLNAQQVLLHESGLADPEIEKATAALVAEVSELKAQIASFEDAKLGNCPQATYLNQLGQLLIQLRLAAGLTQKELASRLGVSKGVISRDEGKLYAGISIERANAILEALGARIDLTARFDSSRENGREKIETTLDPGLIPEPSPFKVRMTLQITAKNPMTVTTEPRKVRETIEKDLLSLYQMTAIERKEKFAGTRGQYALTFTASSIEEKSALLDRLVKDCEPIAARLKCKLVCAFEET